MKTLKRLGTYGTVLKALKSLGTYTTMVNYSKEIAYKHKKNKMSVCKTVTLLTATLIQERATFKLISKELIGNTSSQERIR